MAGNVPEGSEWDDVMYVKFAVLLKLSNTAHLASIAIALTCLVALLLPVRAVVFVVPTLPAWAVLSGKRDGSPTSIATMAAKRMLAWLGAGSITCRDSSAIRTRYRNGARTVGRITRTAQMFALPCGLARVITEVVRRGRRLAHWLRDGLSTVIAWAGVVTFRVLCSTTAFSVSYVRTSPAAIDVLAISNKASFTAKRCSAIGASAGDLCIRSKWTTSLKSLLAGLRAKDTLCAGKTPGGNVKLLSAVRADRGTIGGHRYLLSGVVPRAAATAPGLCCASNYSIGRP